MVKYTTLKQITERRRKLMSIVDMAKAELGELNELRKNMIMKED